MKVVTIVGTRPEIIRIAATWKELDRTVEHHVVHTGQNYDHGLRDVFFDDLQLSTPKTCFALEDVSPIGKVGEIITKTHWVLEEQKPDAVLVLGDTNSALSLYAAKRHGIPTYHMEAGDRSFDERVPEDLNRRVVDQISDILFPYTRYSRENLLREGIHPSKIFVTGSPLPEVYSMVLDTATARRAFEAYDADEHDYFLLSLHREENVDHQANLVQIVDSLVRLVETYGKGIIFPCHPRTFRFLERFGLTQRLEGVAKIIEPVGLVDYLSLQMGAYCVLSDSGTVHEDCSILGVKGVSLRNSCEKPEAIELNQGLLVGLEFDSIHRGIKLQEEIDFCSKIPEAYGYHEVSKTVTNVMCGMNSVIKDRYTRGALR